MFSQGLCVLHSLDKNSLARDNSQTIPVKQTKSSVAALHAKKANSVISQDKRRVLGELMVQLAKVFETAGLTNDLCLWRAEVMGN